MTVESTTNEPVDEPVDEPVATPAPLVDPAAAAKLKEQTVVHEVRADTMVREIRSTVGEIREVAGKERTFRARVCNYNVPDSYRTSWAPGVFTRSLQEKLPKAVWSHDWNRPIGKVTEYHDSAEGLDVEVQLADFDAVPDARMAHSLLKDGIIDNFSFGFVRKSDEPDPNNRGVTRITDVDLDEVSPVLVGAVPGTRTLSVRTKAVDTDDQVGVRAAADILAKFGSGELDLADALNLLKGAGARSTTTKETPVKLTAMQRAMTRTPHAYAATNGDGSVCKTCGGQSDIKAHGLARAPSAIEIRDLSVAITSTDAPSNDSPEDLIAATDAAIDAAITLASYQDLTNLPWWVAQMLALVMSADCSVDAAMVAMNIPDPDEQMASSYARSAIEGREGTPKTSDEKRQADQDDEELRLAMDRIGSWS